METLDYLKQYLHLDGIIVLMVIAAGYFQNYYLKTIVLSRDDKTNSAWKTLLLSTIFCIIYVFVLWRTNSLPKDMWANYFISFISATSFYELLVRPITKFIQKRVNKLTGEADDAATVNKD